MEKSREGVFGRKHDIFDGGSHQARRKVSVGVRVQRQLDFLEAILLIILNKRCKGRCLSTSDFPAPTQMFLKVVTV